MNRYIFAVIVGWLAGVLAAQGQTIDTGSGQGLLDTSGWREVEYSLAQRCGPSGCPVPGRPPSLWNQPRPQYRPPSRPQQSAERLPAIANHVTVIVRVPDSTGASVGSGVIIGTNLVLTAYHVIKDTQGTVQVGNGISATIIAYDATWDLALLRTTHPFGTYATLANYRPAVGEQLFSGGYAGGPLHWTVGPVTEYNRPMQRNEPDWMVCVSGNRSGDSGGPIFNASGQVVGICWGAVDNHARATVCTRIWQVFGQWLSVSAPVDNPGTPSPVEPVGPNAEQWASKLADSIDALRVEIATIKARDATVIKQEVSQAVTQQVTVQAESFGRQLIDKELVPLKSRVDQLELQQQALQLAMASIATGPGGKGDKGEQGLQGIPGTPADESRLAAIEDELGRLKNVVVPVRVWQKVPDDSEHGWHWKITSEDKTTFAKAITIGELPIDIQIVERPKTTAVQQTP